MLLVLAVLPPVADKPRYTHALPARQGVATVTGVTFFCERLLDFKLVSYLLVAALVY